MGGSGSDWMLLGLWNCDSRWGDLGGSGGGTSAVPRAPLKAGEGGKESLFEVTECMCGGGGGGGGGGVGGGQSLPSDGGEAAAEKSVVLPGNPQGGRRGRGGGGGGGGCAAPA